VLPGLVGQRIGGQMERLWVYPIRGYKSFRLVIERKRIMKLKSLLALGVMAAVCGLSASVAKAVSVSFSETGIFGSSGTGIANYSGGAGAGGVTVTFAPIATVNQQVPPTGSVSLGQFTVSAGALNAPFSDTFTLTINQTSPSAGNASFGSATVSGQITINSGGGQVIFSSPLIVSIDGVSYAIKSSDINDALGTVALKAPSSGGGVTTIQGQITAIPVPAAAWTGLTTLAGLAGVGAVRRRRNA